MILLAIDPGPTQSAWLVLNTESIRPRGFAIEPNEAVLEMLSKPATRDFVDRVVIEQVASFGMAVGAEVFETVFWSGRFAEAARPVPFDRLTRLKVKQTLCHDSRANDANIRQALIDRYSDGRGKDVAIGRKASPGPLFGIANDVWSALAVAVTYADRQAATLGLVEP